MLAAAQGHEVALVTPLADDETAATLRELLAGVELVPLAWAGSTAVKQRVRASGQTLLRLDSGGEVGGIGPLPDRDVLAGADAVLASDYGRGMLAANHVRGALRALPARVPVVWDPHPRGMPPLPGARLVTPNESEAAHFAPGEDDAEARAARLQREWGCTAVAVTLGERGALVSFGEQPLRVPAEPASGTDACGAGDSFAVAAAAALARGAVVSDAVASAVAEAGRFVREGGASGVASSAPAGADRVVATSGCFDLLHAGHVAMLAAARRLGDRLVVLLNSDASVRRLKGPERPLVLEHDRARVLEALECVDEVIVFDEDTPTEAVRRLRPQLWVKGGDYAGRRLPEAVALAECGARIVTVPYLEGHSTTGLVARAREAHEMEGAGT